MNKIGRLSAILSGAALLILAALLLFMKFGPASSDVIVITWLVVVIIGTICAVSGIVSGIIGLRKPGKALAAVGLVLGIVYIVTLSILIAMLVEFLRSYTD